MDVQKKFTLNMVTLVVIVIILSVLVFLSATRSPLSQQEEEAPPNFDAESLFKTAEETVAPETPSVPEAPVAVDPQSPPIDDDVIATITFTDNQIPEKATAAGCSVISGRR